MRAVASGSGLSRSALYRAFVPIGRVGHEILRRRVDRLRSAIFRSGRDVRISNLVWTLGFATPSHAARAFKGTHGLAPGKSARKSGPRRGASRGPRTRSSAGLDPGPERIVPALLSGPVGAR
ncbi:hypothetical protein ASG51_01845 [Methylobacterium sp. Leaf465]|nr:hypothetical protein ASG51_01845 [Methylobacterium sp. Leaf465]